MTRRDRREWAGPARFLPPTEPVRRDDGVRHYAGITYAATSGYRPLQLDLWVPRPRRRRRWSSGSTAAAG